MENKISALINMIAGGWCYLELLDELEGTDACRRQIKMRVKTLLPELEKALNEDVPRLWGANGEDADKTLYRIIDGWKCIMTKMKEIPPEYIPGMDEITGMMVTDPEQLMEIVNTHWKEKTMAIKEPVNNNV